MSVKVSGEENQIKTTTKQKQNKTKQNKTTKGDKQAKQTYKPLFLGLLVNAILGSAAIFNSMSPNLISTTEHITLFFEVMYKCILKLL